MAKKPIYITSQQAAEILGKPDEAMQWERHYHGGSRLSYYKKGWRVFYDKREVISYKNKAGYVDPHKYIHITTKPKNAYVRYYGKASHK